MSTAFTKMTRAFVFNKDGKIYKYEVILQTKGRIELYAVHTLNVFDNWVTRYDIRENNEMLTSASSIEELLHIVS